MAKREKRPFVVERSRVDDNGDSLWMPYVSDTWPISAEFESTADALAAIKKEARQGEYRVIQECAVVSVVVEQVAKVSVSEI